MRDFIATAARVVVSLALVGCASDSPTAALRTSAGTGSSVSSPTRPIIQSVSGSRTNADQITPADDPAGLYNQLEADYYAAAGYRITLSGSGFGSTPGTITFSDPNFYADPSGIVWSPLGSSIAFSPRSKLDAMPNGLTVTVTTGGSNPQTSEPYHILLVPTISTRAYGQCTWWVALQEIVQFGDGKEPQVGAYPPLGKPGVVAINDDYVPRRYDAWLDKSNGHQAFVLSLARFSGRVSERNYAATCNCTSYAAGLR